MPIHTQVQTRRTQVGGEPQVVTQVSPRMHSGRTSLFLGAGACMGTGHMRQNRKPHMCGHKEACDTAQGLPPVCPRTPSKALVCGGCFKPKQALSTERRKGRG